MVNRRVRSYRKCLEKLGVDISTELERAYALWLENPQANSLGFKLLHDVPPVGRVKIGDHYRAIMVVDGDTAVWFWVGTHEDYNKFCRKPALQAAQRILRAKNQSAEL